MPSVSSLRDKEQNNLFADVGFLFLSLSLCYAFYVKNKEVPMLSWTEIQTRAAAFAARWRDCAGDERQYGQTFEKSFMQVFGVDWLEGLHEYQLYLPDGAIAYVDYLLPGKILIEMKSRGKSLAAAYSQAMSYVRALKPEETPALVMVCDFDQIHVYSLKKEHPYKPFRVR